jgi:putative transposase
MRVRIDPMDRITMNGIAYGGAVSIPDIGYTLTRLNTKPPLAEAFTYADLQRERGKPGYKFDGGYFDATKAATLVRTNVERLADLPARELPTVMWRLEWCTRFLKRHADGTTSRSDEEMKAVIPLIHSEVVALDVAKKTVTRGKNGKRKRRAGSESVSREAPCEKTLLDWVLRYEEAGFNSCALRNGNRNSGNRSPRLHPKVAKLVLAFAVAFAHPNRPTKKKLYDDLCEAVDALPENVKAVAAGEPLPLPHPSDKTFYAAINKLDKFQVYAGRYGVEAAKRKFVMVLSGLGITRPLERVEMDEWCVSLMTLLIESGIWETLTPERQARVDRVRLWLCVAVDCATRCILGMHLADKASVANVMATLRMVVSDKGVYADAVGALTPWDMGGTPESVVTDSGGSLIADETQSAVLDLTAAPKIPPVGLAHLRGQIERSFGTIHTELISRFSGRTFENTVALGDYKPAANANVENDEIAWALVRYAVDAYHNSPHEGLCGETPRNAWIRLTKMYEVTEPPDADKLRAIFGVRLVKKLRTGGVHVLGVNYNSEHLEAYRRKVGDIDTDVRLDAENMGHVSVRVGPDWLTVPCAHEGFERVTTRTWMAFLADRRRRFAAEAAVDLPTVRQSLRAIEAMNAGAMRSKGIGAMAPTPEEINQAEHDLALGFVLPQPQQDVERTGPGIFGGAIPVGDGDVAPAAAASEPPRPSDTAARNGGNFSIED